MNKRQNVQYFPKNTLGRDFILGDLHGEVSQFQYLLDKVKFNPSKDRVFCVGDLIDKGKDSRAAITLLKEPWFFSVLGNHEVMLLMVASEHTYRDWWHKNGGWWCNEDPKQYEDELRKLPLVIVVGEGANRFNVLHAEFFGSDADLDAEDFSPLVSERLLWGRQILQGNADHISQEGLSLTYSGHTPVVEPCKVKQQFFIDTGAFLDEGYLTLVQHCTQEVFSTNNLGF